MRLKVLLVTFGFFAAALLTGMIAFYQPDIPLETLKTKYAGAPSRFVDVMNMQVHYRDEGAGSDSIPLVLLHGTASSLHTWSACAKEWTKTHRVLRMDLPGFGLTGPNPEHNYSIDMYVDFLASFLEATNIDQCYLAGNSLGGLIAYQFAAAHPDKVKKLVLLDAAGYPITNAKGSLAFTLGRIPVLKNLLKVITPISLVRKSLEDAYGDITLVTDELVEQYRDLACREGNREALVQRLNLEHKTDTTVVGSINIPTLVIWGELDQLIPVTHAYKFSRDLPVDSLVVLPDVGHVPMEESPQLIIPLVNGFIKESL
jgi:pimeloyl-ACP methyl ester carboxylesterase